MRHENVLSSEATAAHHDAVIEGACEIELGEVRAHGAPFRPEELVKALRIEQPCNALAR
jgi:hypothetical protein